MDRYRDLLVERKRRLVEKIELKLDRLGEDDKGKVTELIEEMETDMISALENVNNEEDPNKRFNRLTSINDVNRRVASNELIKRILKPKVEKEGTANVPAESAADTPAAEQEGVLQSDVSTEDQLPDEAKQETKKPLQELSDEELKTAEDEVSEEIEKIRKGLKETETSSEEIRGINEKYVQSMNSHRDILEEKWRRLFIEYESDTEIVGSRMYEGMNARLQRIINQYNQENDPNEKYYHLGDYDKTLELYRQKIINTVIVRERNIKREKEERERKKRRWF